ncbi:MULTISPECIES: malate synthase A [Azospira]|uniref:Malate synthase n=2 Tax=Azospira oryzae TaxID=146939 RepID=G8QKQ6_AZOOP|nr:MULTISPECIES: malate synthase A [Azospira]AEV24444.1 malate synthase A [Azospira oryzae PS]MDK9689791.1 malate synthase A [Azospira sp.]RZT90749.1 malate synthase [Azospira oryzae]TLS17981.1 MAG: malate synthase A [Betaproteobacteria bacterium]
MSLNLPAGMQITAPIQPQYESILTLEALEFVAKLHRAFEGRRQELLKARVERQARIDAGEMPDFLPETKHIREGDWKVAPLPAALERRRTEITGPVEAKMIINAFNSGADSYMTDFEDSNSPNWDNQIQGQVNLYQAIRRQLSFKNEAGKEYKLNDQIATLQIRPRGWHLDEKHVTVDGQRVAGGIFDFALVFFHNAKEQIARGAGPFYYLPKMESHLEARLWNDIFVMAQDHIGLPQGTIKATVLVETILATFEMEEILYELRNHSAGLNAGRWDYIFSCIKKFKKNKDFCLAQRGVITMEVPFMRSYALALVQACHKRGAPAMGGMSALIPIKNDPVANEKALAGIRHDKARDAKDGFDGGWVAHPGLVSIAHEEFVKVLGDKPNQWEKQVEGSFGPKDWLNFQPEQPITEAGLRNNINVGIHYLGSWLAGNGCVPIHNLMEDAATAEISRSQVWQWVVSPKGILDDGRKVTVEMVRPMIAEELAKVKATVAAQGEDTATYDQAAVIFDKMSLTPDYPEFLTLPLYEAMA